MICRFIITAIALLFCATLIGQPPSSREEIEAEYQRRIRQETLNGVYIPKDLTDAFVQLNKLIDEESKMAFKTVPEDTAARKLFFSFGRWVTRNWGFYGGSRLSHFLRELGVTYPEDMARFIIITYHRNLNRKPLNVKELVEQFAEKRRQEHLELLEGGKIIREETRKRKNGG